MLVLLGVLLSWIPWSEGSLGQRLVWPWLLVSAGLLAALSYCWGRPGLTAQGRAVLADVRRRYEPLLSNARGEGALSHELLPMTVALFGVHQLAGSELSRLAPELAHSPAPASPAAVGSAGGGGSCGGGVGCGGGGDGGGGGCGGCGGGCGG